MVEAADDEQRHTEEDREHRTLLLGQIDAYVDDQAAADGPQEGPQRSDCDASGDDRLRPRLRLAAEIPGQQTQQYAADDVEEPDFRQGPDVIDDAGFACIERNAEIDDAHESEGENDGAGDAAQGEETVGSQTNQDTGEKRFSVHG